MEPDKDREPAISTGVDIDPEEFAREALLGPESEPDLDIQVDDKDGEELEADDDAQDQADPEGDNPAEGETDDAGSEDEETDDSAGVEPDEFAVAAREMGLGENFVTRDEVLQAHREMRDRLSTRDDDAALGRFYREQGIKPAEVEASGDSQVTPEEPEPIVDPKGWNPPVQKDPLWLTLTQEKRDPDSGDLLGYEGPDKLVQARTEYEAYKRQYWDGVMDDPSKLAVALQPLVDERVAEQERNREAATIQKSAREAAHKFNEENKKLLDEHGDEFWNLVGEGMTPERAKKHLELEIRLKVLEEGSSKGEEAKKTDLARARKVRRSAVTRTPIKEPKPAANLSIEEIFAEALTSIPEDERAGIEL